MSYLNLLMLNFFSAVQVNKISYYTIDSSKHILYYILCSSPGMHNLHFYFNHAFWFTRIVILKKKSCTLRFNNLLGKMGSLFKKISLYPKSLNSTYNKNQNLNKCTVKENWGEWECLMNYVKYYKVEIKIKIMYYYVSIKITHE